MLRNFEDNIPQKQFYAAQRAEQTFERVLELKEEYGKLDKKEMTMKEAFHLLDTYIDPSDPDIGKANIVHAYQTAQRARSMRPLDRNYHLLGLIHDIGKVLFSFGMKPEFVVGDTFVVGCAWPEKAVYPETFFNNPDTLNPLYSTKLGVYEPSCGLGNLVVSFGHDEYLFLVLAGNKDRHSFPEELWNVIRFHSLYPLHSGGEYSHLLAPMDAETIKALREFNDLDLYSKTDSDVISQETVEYYDQLLDERFPEPLRW